MIAKYNCIFLSFALISQVLAAPEKKILYGVVYNVLHVSADSIRIIWQDNAGKQLRTFPEAARYLLSEGINVDTIMNGGIFGIEGVPLGLLIQDSKTLNLVNRNDGTGNFFLQPNGIFLIGSKGAAVIQTYEYPPPDVKINYAVQSGPLLLRHGTIHPSFNAHSTSKLHRNGVGISKSGEVVFVITDVDSPQFSNLYEFAQVFYRLECDDALFLDGIVSQMRSGADIAKSSNYFGSIITVTNSKKSNDMNNLHYSNKQ